MLINKGGEGFLAKGVNFICLDHNEMWMGPSTHMLRLFISHLSSAMTAGNYCGNAIFQVTISHFTNCITYILACVRVSKCAWVSARERVRVSECAWESARERVRVSECA
jgi:hypothetical protein